MFSLKLGIPWRTHFTPWKSLKLETLGISKSGSEGGLRIRPDPFPTPMLLVMAPQHGPTEGRDAVLKTTSRKTHILNSGPSEPTLLSHQTAVRLRPPGRTSWRENIHTPRQVGFTWTAQQDPPSVKPTSDKAAHTQKASSHILRTTRELPGGPVVWTPCFYCRGSRSDPWSVN